MANVTNNQNYLYSLQTFEPEMEDIIVKLISNS